MPLYISFFIQKIETQLLQNQPFNKCNSSMVLFIGLNRRLKKEQFFFAYIYI